MKDQNTTRYKPVTPEILEELRGILGRQNVQTEHDKLEGYSHDETDAAEYGHFPEVVVFPITTEQVARVVKLANREGIPITPRGAGSGLSGGGHTSIRRYSYLLGKNEPSGGVGSG